MKTAVIEAGLAQMDRGRGGRGGPCSRWERRSHPWSGRDCGHGAPLGPPVRRAPSNQLTGQTVTETEIISIIYGIYSIHCEDLMGKVARSG